MSKQAAVRGEGFGWSLRCAIGLHRWRKWGPVETILVTREKVVMMHMPIGGVEFTSSGPIEWDEFRQTRECGACGIIGRREVQP